MNNLPAVGAQVSQSNQLVLSDQEVYVGQEMLDEGPWWSSMILFLAIGVVAFFSWAAWFEIDQSVRAAGQIIPTERNRISPGPNRLHCFDPPFEFCFRC